MGEKKDNSVLAYSQNLDLCVCDVKEDYLEPGADQREERKREWGTFGDLNKGY